jgi:membrane-bound lytic murein transglycosylase D
VQYFTKSVDYCHDDENNVYFPDSIYQERLGNFHIIPCNTIMLYVNALIYMRNVDEFGAVYIGNGGLLFPDHGAVLDEHDLPLN